jgi:hypothetical protein
MTIKQLIKRLQAHEKVNSRIKVRVCVGPRKYEEVLCADRDCFATNVVIYVKEAISNMNTNTYIIVNTAPNTPTLFLERLFANKPVWVDDRRQAMRWDNVEDAERFALLDARLGPGNFKVEEL